MDERNTPQKSRLVPRRKWPHMDEDDVRAHLRPDVEPCERSLSLRVSSCIDRLFAQLQDLKPDLVVRFVEMIEELDAKPKAVELAVFVSGGTGQAELGQRLEANDRAVRATFTKGL